MTMPKVSCRVVADILFSAPVLCVAVLVLAQVLTWYAPKDDNSDAWAYHYYSGALLLDDRMNNDYFAASSQSYFNPLVHAPFSAMVKAEWPDRWVAAAMALYSSFSLVLVVLFYRFSLQLKRGELFAALLMSINFLVVWTCTGTSVPDLFLQIPALLALLFFIGFGRVGAQQNKRYFSWSGFCLGVALGLKLSAIIYVPGFAVLFLLGLLTRRIGFFQVFSFGGMVVFGYLLVYGWWGGLLYQKFGNPFFPLFNEWFHSPDFAQEALSNKRFIAASLMDQLFLPFRMALSDVFAYMEIRAPDLRPAAFVMAFFFLLAVWIIAGKKISDRLTISAWEFLLFLSVSFWVWVLISGNGRYAVGILLLIGGGLLVALRTALPLRWFRSVFLLVFLLQSGVIAQQVSIDTVPFRMRDTAWGGQWFNADFSSVLGEGNQLVLTGTRSPLTVIAKDMGKGSALINVAGIFALDDSAAIQEKIHQYQGRILGMMMAGPDARMNPVWIEKVYFEQFSRFGLRVSDADRCRVIPKLDQGNKVGANFIFCPMVKDEFIAQRYMDITQRARLYFSKIEEVCPDIFTPRMNAVQLSEQNKTKYYANYEIDVYVAKDESVMAKKQWSMVMFSLGNIEDVFTTRPDLWKEQHCEPLRSVRAMPEE